MLVVSGGPSPGTFRPSGHNHGKTAYKKDGNPLGWIYYWDDRDGSSLQGWWLGPEIGDTEVWALQHSNTDTPPTSGWAWPPTALYVSVLPMQIQMQAIVLQNGFNLCCFVDSIGATCVDPVPSSEPFCIRGMCGRHCCMFAADCGRHNCAWQLRQNQKPRRERGNRRRGGSRPY